MPTIEQIETLLSREPDDVFLNFALAMERAKAGDVESALERFDRVIELDADYHAAFYHKGNLLIGLGRREAAGETLRRGIEAAQRRGDGHAAEEMAELLSSAGP